MLIDDVDTIEGDSLLRKMARSANSIAGPDISPTWVDVPDISRAVKAIFASHPSEEVIREIKDFTAETGKPYEWHGHTHTAPPMEGTPPVYVGRVEIPAIARKRKEFSPCPCCTPNHRKFGEGLIAWFEDEWVIRIIGKDCFAAINSAGHEEAYRDLVRRENERNQLEHLLRIVGNLPRWIKVGEQLLPIAKAADNFFPQIENRITTSQGVSNFWREIRGGVLHLNETVAKVAVRRDGTEEEVEEGKELVETIRVGSFRIEGESAMNPVRRPVYPALVETVMGLRAMESVSSQDVQTLTPAERNQASRELKRCLDLLKKKRTELQEQVRFLSQLNIDRLSQWARNSKSPVDFSISRKTGVLTIGGRRGDYVFDIPEELRLLSIPAIKGI